MPDPLTLILILLVLLLAALYVWGLTGQPEQSTEYAVDVLNRESGQAVEMRMWAQSREDAQDIAIVRSIQEHGWRDVVCCVREVE